jgi:hypothetical protein
MTLCTPEYLRETAAHSGVPPGPAKNALRDAADEIERLQADLATFGKDTEATENRIINAEFAAQWMRTALEDIAEGIWHPDTPPAEIISDVRQRAKAALAGPSAPLKVD